MSDDPNNLEMGENESNQSGSGSNRTFMLIAGIIGALVVLVLVILAIYALVVLPRNKNARNAEATQHVQANISTAAALTSVAKTLTAVRPTLAVAAAATATIAPSATVAPKPSATPVVAQPTSTNTPLPPKEGEDPRTATVSALLTQAAQAKLTITGTTTTTALPKTGFADDAGIPGLMGMAVLLVVVIFLVRRLRVSNAAH